MKTHRELVDGYLDASWALAMERVAVRQGELAGALEERLARDPGAAVPRRTVKRCRAAIRRAFAPPPARRVRTVLTRVLIAAVLCGLLTTSACAVSTQFKAFLTHIFYSVAETFTSLTLRDPQIEDVSKSHGQAMEVNGLRFEWLPEGYEYVDGEETERSRWVEFENERQEYIQIRVMGLAEAAAYTYDSESGEGERVAIGDYEGRLIDEGPYTLLFWVDEQRGEATMILASALSQEGILQLAESLRYEK